MPTERPSLVQRFSLLPILSTFVAASVAAWPTSAAPVCRDLPATELRIFYAQPPKSPELSMTKAEMDRLADADKISAEARAAHPLMLIVAELGAKVHVEHRTIAVRYDGATAYCDAPTSVDLGLGTFGRKVVLWREAAADSCVKQALLRHYEEHSRALDNKTEDFVHQRYQEFALGLRDLKYKPYPDRQTAVRGFETGLRAFLRTMINRFDAEIDRSRRDIDTAERLEALRNACGARIREMEHQLDQGIIEKRAQDYSNPTRHE